ncbi:MAG: hypothetical protein OEW42_09635 [Acidimicrobiia bacterium]|nr:hypothetical protein [Acidimicrobiia bacterium]MDH5238032.1 hypothetical protein [Acidimicrobiia bacterium]
MSGNNGSAKRPAKKTRSRNRNRSKKSKQSPRLFWGDPTTLPEPRDYDPSSPDVTAVVRSLGRPPIPGQEGAAMHYFTVVYERAVVLATALAAVGGLNDDAAPASDESD